MTTSPAPHGPGALMRALDQAPPYEFGDELDEHLRTQVGAFVAPCRWPTTPSRPSSPCPGHSGQTVSRAWGPRRRVVSRLVSAQCLRGKTGLGRGGRSSRRQVGLHRRSSAPLPGSSPALSRTASAHWRGRSRTLLPPRTRSVTCGNWASPAGPSRWSTLASTQRCSPPTPPAQRARARTRHGL